jgi:predicted Zn-dependent protease
MPLDEEQQCRLAAAEGFCELGMPIEAEGELQKLNPSAQQAPETLGVKMRIYRALEKWSLMEKVAMDLVQEEPHKLGRWIDYADALSRIQTLRDGIGILESALEQFPDDADLHYELACYECRDGNPMGGREYLDRCIRLNFNLREKALRDPFLEILWDSL